MNNMRYLFTTLCLVLLTGLAGINGSAIASTPDGMTPANEHECDNLKSATPGLYGLCVAYCEAQDLDTIDKNPPSEKILANYRKKMQSGDPDMPCVATPCPCWTPEQFNRITTDGTGAACLSSGTTLQLVDDAAATRFASSDTSSRCTFVDLNVPVPGLTDPTAPKVTSLNITSDEAQSCHSTIVQACSDLGL